MPPLPKMHATTGSNRRFWLVYARAFDGDPRGLLLDSLQASAGLSARVKLAGVDIYEAAGFQGPVPPPRRSDAP